MEVKAHKCLSVMHKGPFVFDQHLNFIAYFKDHKIIVSTFTLNTWGKLDQSQVAII